MRIRILDAVHYRTPIRFDADPKRVLIDK